MQTIKSGQRSILVNALIVKIAHYRTISITDFYSVFLRNGRVPRLRLPIVIQASHHFLTSWRKRSEYIFTAEMIKPGNGHAMILPGYSLLIEKPSKNKRYGMCLSRTSVNPAPKFHRSLAIIQNHGLFRCWMNYPR